MTKKLFTLLGFIAIGFTANAQTWIEDTVSMGAGYANDIYYSLKNGKQRIEGNKNWHVGFSLSIADSAAVWANHNGGTSFVKVYNPHKNYAQWSTVTLADTATTDMLYNKDQAWYQGAFNNIPSASPFDFGWGIYDPTTHAVNGDSVFIVKANNVFYKFCIKSLDATVYKWNFVYADLTNAGADVSDSISKQPNYANNLFAYYNFATGNDTNREPAIANWDLQFLRYTTDDSLAGPAANNTVVGTFLNRGVQAVRAYPVLVDSAFAHYGNYTPSLSPVISTIGRKWKDFIANAWVIIDSNSYFVKDKSGNIYQLEFVNFGGSATGDIYFHKRIVEPAAVADIHSTIAQYNIFPVPASNEINIMLDAKKEAEAILYVTDLTGKKIASQQIKLVAGINGFKMPINQLANGNYILSVQGKAIQLSQKFSVAK
jgi:hypothetical protein